MGPSLVSVGRLSKPEVEDPGLGLGLRCLGEIRKVRNCCGGTMRTVPVMTQPETNYKLSREESFIFLKTARLRRGVENVFWLTRACINNNNMQTL